MAVRYAALSACRKVHVCHCNSLGGAMWRSVTITGRTDRQTDRVRRIMRPPPREEPNKTLRETQTLRAAFAGGVRPSLTQIWSRFMVTTHGGSVLYVCTKFEADSSFRSKVIEGSQNFEIGSRDPGHAHSGVVLLSAGVVRPPSLCRIWSGLFNSFKRY